MSKCLSLTPKSKIYLAILSKMCNSICAKIGYTGKIQFLRSSLLSCNLCDIQLLYIWAYEKVPVKVYQGTHTFPELHLCDHKEASNIYHPCLLFSLALVLWPSDYLRSECLTKISRVKPTWTLNVRRVRTYIKYFVCNPFVYMTKTHLFFHSFMKVKRSSSYYHRRNKGNYSFMFPVILYTNDFIYKYFNLWHRLLWLKDTSEHAYYQHLYYLLFYTLPISIVLVQFQFNYIHCY